MHALGNDFVMIDLITQNVSLESPHIQRIADRHFGIGCDQVILLLPPIRPDADFFYRIFNADGQEVEQCGNGARCAARFFYDMGFVHHKTLHADCLAGPIQFQIEEDETISMNMGIPSFTPEQIPMNLPKAENVYSLSLADVPSFQENSHENFFNREAKSISLTAVSVGNPHTVLQVSDIETVRVDDWGKILSTHALFPKGTNVEFMQIINPSHIRLRVYERGVGETLACGTGAAAAAIAGIKQNLLQSPVTVAFLQGELQVHWAGEDSTIIMKGPAISVFAGRFRL